MWFIYTMECYEKQRHEFFKKMRELGNIIQSEGTQTQKNMYGMYSLISGYQQNVENTRDTLTDPIKLNKKKGGTGSGMGETGEMPRRQGN